MRPEALISYKMAFTQHHPLPRAPRGPEKHPSAGKDLEKTSRKLGAHSSPAGFQELARPEPAAPDRTGACSWLYGRDKAPGIGGKRVFPASGLQEEGKKSTGGREQ